MESHRGRAAVVYIGCELATHHWWQPPIMCLHDAGPLQCCMPCSRCVACNTAVAQHHAGIEHKRLPLSTACHNGLASEAACCWLHSTTMLLAA
jgi:hypothetical protein